MYDLTLKQYVRLKQCVRAEVDAENGEEMESATKGGSDD